MASNLFNQDFTFRNLTITGNLTQSSISEILTTNLIQNTADTTSINMNDNNSIDINATNGSLNITSQNMYLNTGTIRNSNDLRLTTEGQKILYINNDKGGGNLNINTGCSNVDTHFDTGDIYLSQGNFYYNNNIINSSGNIHINPIQYLVIQGMINTYFLSQLTVSYNMIFVGQTDYNNTINFYLDFAPTSVNIIVINQMSNFNLNLINNTGNFYGLFQNNNSNQLVLGFNQYATLISAAGGWYILVSNV